jgi:hypothetical protein
MLDGQGYDISCDLVMKVSVEVYVARTNNNTSMNKTIGYYYYMPMLMLEVCYVS